MDESITPADALACLADAAHQYAQRHGAKKPLHAALATILFRFAAKDYERAAGGTPYRPTPNRRTAVLKLLSESASFSPSSFQGNRRVQLDMEREVADLAPFQTQDGRCLRVIGPEHKRGAARELYLTVQEVSAGNVDTQKDQPGSAASLVPEHRGPESGASTPPPALLGTAYVRLYVEREQQLQEPPEERKPFLGIPYDKAAKLEFREKLLYVRERVSGVFAYGEQQTDGTSGVKLINEVIHYDEKTNRVWGHAELTLPPYFGVVELPSFLGIWAEVINVDRVIVVFRPQNLNACWNQICDGLSRADPQPLWFSAAEQFHGAGPTGFDYSVKRSLIERGEFEVHLSLWARSAKDLCASMRNFALLGFLRNTLGLPLDDIC